jgi:hypothetical protein
MLNYLGLSIKQIPDELKRVQLVDKSKVEYFDNIIKRKSEQNTGRSFGLTDESRRNEFAVLRDYYDSLTVVDLTSGASKDYIDMMWEGLWEKIDSIAKKSRYLDLLNTNIDTNLDNSNVQISANSGASQLSILYDRNYLLLCNAITRGTFIE